MLNFWASWCEPCKDELPLLTKAQSYLRSVNATVVGINQRDISDDALSTVKRYGVTFPSLRDIDAQLAQSFGNTGVPETFILDRKGRIAARQRGTINQSWLARTVTPLVRERS